MRTATMVAVLVASCGGSSAPVALPSHQVHRRGNCPPEREDGSYDLDAEQARNRRGVTATRFGDTITTQKQPIQVCGLAGELTWLLRMTCADGSRPWGNDLDQAHAARTDSAMENLLSCDKPVELYIAPCPERSYEIYLDTYQCGPDEEFWRTVKLREPAP